MDVGVALEQSTKSDGKKDSIFFVYYTQYDEKKVGFHVPTWFRRKGSNKNKTRSTKCINTDSLLMHVQYLQVFINEVTALVPVLQDCHYTFAVYTAERTKQRWPLILAAPSEKEMNDWVTLLSSCKNW